MVDYSIAPLSKSIREGKLRINSVSYFSPKLEKYIRRFVKPEYTNPVKDEASAKLDNTKEQKFKELNTFYSSKQYSIRFLRTLKPKPIRKPIQLKPTIGELREDCKERVINPMNSNVQELENYGRGFGIGRMQESARTRYEKSMKKTVPFFYKKCNTGVIDEYSYNHEDEIDAVGVIVSVRYIKL
jgi:hypothetical protein